MNAIIRENAGLIFMKVGIHAGEGIEEIIERKMAEFRNAGRIFWGYGGNTCFPTSYVQPFAERFAAQGQQTFIVMHKMNSNHFAEPALATEYSKDGINWEKIPNGINVRGSRFAMVLGELTETQLELNLRNLIVGVGRSQGARGMDYIQGRVDKGCFEYHETGEQPDPEQMKHIDLVAPVVPPYAVFLRQK